MKLHDIVCRQAIVPELRAEQRDGVFLELIEALADAGKIKHEHAEDVLMTLLKREAFGTTALGNSVAIPHAKVKLCSEFCGALGISRAGIDFGAGDGRRVHVVFLFISPEQAISGHLQLMAHIAAIARSPRFIRELRKARTARDVESLLESAESMLFSEPDEPDESD